MIGMPVVEEEKGADHAWSLRLHFREEGEEVLEFLKPLKGWPRPPGLTK